MPYHNAELGRFRDRVACRLAKIMDREDISEAARTAIRFLVDDLDGLHREDLFSHEKAHEKVTEIPLAPVALGDSMSSLDSPARVVIMEPCRTCQGAKEVFAGCHHCDEFVYHSKCDSYYSKCSECAGKGEVRSEISNEA